MNVLLPILAASILVVAQASWKKAFSSVAFNFSFGFIFSKQFLSIILSPYFLFGGALYVGATIFYIYLFNRFSFYSVQSTMLVTSIILSFIIASIAFKEQINIYNVIGLLFLVGGITLVFKK